MRPKLSAAFTFLEIMVTISIIGLLAVILIPNLAENKAAADLVAARGQALALQTALTGWLTDASSVSEARTQFGAASGSSNPGSTASFLNVLGRFLDASTRANFSVSSSDPTGTRIATPNMVSKGWYMVIVWPSASWTSEHPRVDLFTP